MELNKRKDYRVLEDTIKHLQGEIRIWTKNKSPELVADCKREMKECSDALEQLKTGDSFWNDDKVINFVNWYVEIHKLRARYTLENREILDSFKRGDKTSVWAGKLQP